jgi:hypothetical protein
MDPATIMAGIQGIGALAGLFGGGGGMSGAEKNALKAQTELSKIMGDIYKKQSAMDLPYRKDLYGALQQRVNQQRPRFLPGAPTYSNPSARTRQAQPNVRAQGAQRPQQMPQQQSLPPQLLQALMQRMGGQQPSGGLPAALAAGQYSGQQGGIARNTGMPRLPGQ